MNISTEFYRVFYKVAQLKSFSRAAEELFISQSAVSQSIKNLEKKLGFPLLLRTTKSVQLTLDGRLLFSQLEQAFRIIENAEEGLKYRYNPHGGQIVFAATDTLCKYFLLPKIKLTSQAYPNIKFKIINGTSFECIDLLKNAAVDFALINIPENSDNYLEILKKYDFQDVFIASEDYPIQNSASLAEIAQQPLLVLDVKSVTRSFLEKLFARHRIAFNPEIQLQNMDLLIDMAEMGMGISFVPDLYVKNRKVKQIKLKEELPQRSFGLISLKNMPLTPAAETFLSLL